MFNNKIVEDFLKDHEPDLRALDKILDKELFHDLLDYPSNSEYIIGIDTYDKDNCAYCVIRHTNGKMYVVSSNNKMNEETLNKEVDRLSKIYNAKIIQ